MGCFAVFILPGVTTKSSFGLAASSGLRWVRYEYSFSKLSFKLSVPLCLQQVRAVLNFEIASPKMKGCPQQLWAVLPFLTAIPNEKGDQQKVRAILRAPFLIARPRGKELSMEGAGGTTCSELLVKKVRTANT